MKLKRFDELNEELSKDEYLKKCASNEKILNKASKYLNMDVEAGGIGWKAIIKKLEKRKEDIDIVIEELKKGLENSKELDKTVKDWNKNFDKKYKK